MKPFHKQRLVTRGCFLGGVVYMKPLHKQRLVARGCFLGGVVYMKPFHKQRLVTRGCFLWGGLFTWNPSTNKDWWPVVVFWGGGLFTWNLGTDKDWWPVVVFLGGGCLHETLPQTKTGDPWLFSWILKDICFSPGACKQRLGTRVLFSWGGGVVYNKFLKIFVSPQGPANKDWEPVCCFLGGGCLQQILKNICFSPGACKQRLGTRALFWGGGGGGGRTSPKQLENRKL